MVHPPPPPPPRPPRVFKADDILAGRVGLDGYPFRYIVIGPSTGTVFKAGFGGGNTMLDVVLSAVEFLETRGWELVTVDQGGAVACMRRSR